MLIRLKILRTKMYKKFKISVIHFLLIYALKGYFCCRIEPESWNQCIISEDIAHLKTECQEFVYYDQLFIDEIKINIVPNNLFANFCVNKMFLWDTGINMISNTAFAGIAFLKELNINHNQFELIDDLIYSLNANFLTRLDLSFNKIKQLPERFPKNYSNLTTLLFNNNNIELIWDFTFENLISLTTLELNHNRLRVLEDFAFVGLKCLEQLKLVGNYIFEISRHSFGDLFKLNSLNLDENLMEFINKTFDNLSSLTTLSVRSNRIRNIEDGAFLNLIHLETLGISKNPLADSVKFKELANLKYLEVNFADGMRELNTNTFWPIRKPTMISFLQSKIETIEDGAFRNVSQLTILNLRYNRLTTLKNNYFKSLSYLQILLIDRNLISQIEPQTFQYLKSLKNVYLTNNLIKNLHCQMFFGLKSLSNVYLSFNKIKQIQTGTFSNLPKLYSVLLDGNLIENIEIDSFANISALNTLDLSSNKLFSIVSSYFLCQKSNSKRQSYQ